MDNRDRALVGVAQFFSSHTICPVECVSRNTLLDNALGPPVDFDRCMSCNLSDGVLHAAIVIMVVM